MTTRRNALKLAAGAVVTAPGPGRVFASETHTNDSRSDREVLIACRDEIRCIERQIDDPDPMPLMLAALNLDNEIMKLCPHDPATYTIQPCEEIPGVRPSHHVTCPSCRATTSLEYLILVRNVDGVQMP